MPVLGYFNDRVTDNRTALRVQGDAGVFEAAMIQIAPVRILVDPGSAGNIVRRIDRPARVTM